MRTKWTFSSGKYSKTQPLIPLKLMIIFAPLLLVALSLMALTTTQAEGASSRQAAPQACATMISGNISSNTTWTVASSPYCLQYDIGVNSGVTLTIQAGVTVYGLSPSTGLSVDGSLVAIGTAAQPILFTSANTVPAPQDWQSVRIFINGSAQLEHCDVSYAGAGYGDGVEVQSSNFKMNHCRIHHNWGSGLRFFGNNGEAASIADSQFDHNTGAAVLEDPGASGQYDRGPTYTNLTFSANGTDALVVTEGTLDYNRTFNGPASFNGSPVLLTEHAYYVSPGRTITFTPGTTVQFNKPYGELNIDGSLVAQGTLTQPITFTTNVPSPDPGSWRRIIVNGAGKARLSYINMGYANEGLRIESSDVQVSHSRIHHSQGYGVYLYGNGVQGVSIADSQIDHNAGAAIFEQPGGGVTHGPIYTNLTFAANGTNALVVSQGTLNYDRSFDGPGSFNGSPIILSDQALNVSPSHTITFTPGTTVQFNQPNGELNIDGSLVAQGTPTQPITFTTNATSPLPGSWRRIIITGAGMARLTYVNLGYTSEGLRLESSNVQVNQTRIHHSQGNGVYIFAVHASLVNDVVTDNGAMGIMVAAGGKLDGRHTTLARNGTGLYLEPGTTATLTNTILAHNTFGVDIHGDGNATLVRTLWDSNTTPVQGSISESGHINGLAGFAADGYHITLASAAIHAGVNAGVTVDIDGESRPQPPNSAPDLGADEIYSPPKLFIPLVRK